MQLNTILTAALLRAPGLALALCSETSSRAVSTPQTDVTERKKEYPISWPHQQEIFMALFGKSASNKEGKGILLIIKWDYDESKIWLCLKYDLTPSPFPAWWRMRGRQTSRSGRSGPQQGILDRRFSQSTTICIENVCLSKEKQSVIAVQQTCLTYDR